MAIEALMESLGAPAPEGVQSSNPCEVRRWAMERVLQWVEIRGCLWEWDDAIKNADALTSWVQHGLPKSPRTQMAPKRYQRVSPDELAEWKRLHDEGLSVRQIEEKIGRPRRAISQAVHLRGGWDALP